MSIFNRSPLASWQFGGLEQLSESARRVLLAQQQVRDPFAPVGGIDAALHDHPPLADYAAEMMAIGAPDRMFQPVERQVAHLGLEGSLSEDEDGLSAFGGVANEEDPVSLDETLFGMSDESEDLFGLDDLDLFGAEDEGLFGADNEDLFGADNQDLFGEEAPDLFGGLAETEGGVFAGHLDPDAPPALFDEAFGEEPEGDEGAEDEDEDESEDPSHDGDPVDHAPTGTSTVREKPKAKKAKKGKMTCKKMRAKVGKAQQKMWSSNVLTAQRSEYEKEVNAGKGWMRAHGCTGIPT